MFSLYTSLFTVRDVVEVSFCVYVYCVLLLCIIENLFQRPYEVCTVQEALCQYSFLPKTEYSVLLQKFSPPPVTFKELSFKQLKILKGFLTLLT